MTCKELIHGILKGGTVASISEKQKEFILNLAWTEKRWRQEGKAVVFSDHYYKITEATHMAAGYGGTRAKKVIPGRYNLELKYYIRFNKPPHQTTVASPGDLLFYEKQGQPFTFLNPDHWLFFPKPLNPKNTI